MSLLISFALLLLAFLGYSYDRRLFNPLFINPLIWGGLILLYEIIPNDLFVLQEQFLRSVVIWVIAFTISCFISQYNKVGNYRSFEIYNKKIFNIYYYIILIFAPLTFLTLVLEALKVGPEMFFLRLRMINTGLDEDDTFNLGYLSYVFNFVTVVCLLFTYYYERISKKKYYVVLFLAFLLGIITLARTSVVMLIIGIFIILYFKSKIKKIHYTYFLIVFFSFLLLITGLRDQHNSANTSLGDTISIYLMGGFPAFDTVVHNINDGQFGSFTFRFFYAVLSIFDKSVVVEKTILTYVQIPHLTNVYTILFPFFKDFGYMGIAFFGIIYGLIFGFLYKKSKQNNSFYVLLNSLFLPCLLMQFMGEYIFMNFSTYLQYIIILVTPYIFRLSR